LKNRLFELLPGKEPNNPREPGVCEVETGKQWKRKKR